MHHTGTVLSQSHPVTAVFEQTPALITLRYPPPPPPPFAPLPSAGCSHEGPVRYTAADLMEKNTGGLGQMLLDLLDNACTNELVGVVSRSDRYRSAQCFCLFGAFG